MSNAENSLSVPSSSPSLFAVPFIFPVPPSPLAAPETTSFAPPTPVIPAKFRLANSADIWATTYPSATFLFRPLDCTSVPASAVQPYPANVDSYMSASPYPNSPWPSAFPHYREVERQPHDHERRTFTPTEPRAHDPTKLQYHMNDEPTEYCKRDHAEPDM